jgi:hypothetical protein
MHWVIEEATTWLAKDGIANAFGLVLYTDRHSNLAKVLGDDVFWRGLDDRTGDRWPIFVLKRPPGGTERPVRRPGQLKMMVDVWREPAENRAILEQLGLASTRRPYLAIYSVLDDEHTLVQTVALSDDSVEDAHATLKDALDAATRAIEDVAPANIKSADGMQAAVDIVVTDLKQRRMIKKAMPLLKIFKSFFGGHPAA